MMMRRKSFVKCVSNIKHWSIPICEDDLVNFQIKMKIERRKDEVASIVIVIDRKPR